MTGALPVASVETRRLFAILQERDLQSALQNGLEWLVDAAEAEAGTLCFATGDHPTLLRVGRLPSAVLSVARLWERAFLESFRRARPTNDGIHQTTLRDGRTLVKLPIATDELVVGTSALVLPPGRHFEASQANELSLLAATLAGAWKLLGDLDRTRDQLKRLGLLYEIGQALASTLDLSQLLRDTMRLAQETMRAQASSLMLIDRETDELVLEIVHGAKRDELHQLRMPLRSGIAGWVATNGIPLIVNDPYADPRFSPQNDIRTGFLTRNILCVPLEIKGRVIGVLQVLNKSSDGGFDDDDLELMRTLASQAAVAVENARLYRNLQQERDRIIAAQEDVRRGLARDLHDGTVQILTALGLSLQHARRMLLAQRPVEKVAAELEAMSALADRAIRETRTLLFELRPVVLETQGLVAGLAAYVERLNADEHRETRVLLDAPEALPRLPAKVERTLFAIIQEAVTNARKHAHARTIRIMIGAEEETLALVVQDDGQGFDLHAIQDGYAYSGSLGLINMRE
ncbi:MAG TPA: GAF domain-containing protein, partial [Ardenticatenaceae bacterium]|nr:GAF domain-containing protein [Ardenticatenaceae bacterium]